MDLAEDEGELEAAIGAAEEAGVERHARWMAQQVLSKLVAARVRREEELAAAELLLEAAVDGDDLDELDAAIDAARAAGVDDEALLAAAEEARAGATGAGWDWGTLVAGAADAIAADAADAAPAEAEAEEVEMAEAETVTAELPLPPAQEGVEGERV